MSEFSGFFNAKIDASGKYDRIYAADDMASCFASFIGNGVVNNGTDALQVIPLTQPAMKVRVLAGRAWINGYWYENKTVKDLRLDSASNLENRVDVIVLRLNFSERTIQLDVKKGKNMYYITSEPPIDSPVRDSNVYEIYLAKIRIVSGTISITSDEISDLRNNEQYCGFVRSLI